MARVLHLVKPGDPALAEATIEAQVAAGDQVTVVLLHGAGPVALPAGVTVHRLTEECSYAALLDLVFEADHVVTW